MLISVLFQKVLFSYFCCLSLILMKYKMSIKLLIGNIRKYREAEKYNKYIKYIFFPITRFPFSPSKESMIKNTCPLMYGIVKWYTIVRRRRKKKKNANFQLKNPKNFTK